MAQDPWYLSYQDENKLPSNEVYSIAQDKQGFIWIGCDAGLFRFDGFRYQAFASKNQESNAISGLTFSYSRTLYCFNFKNQVFYLENEQLKELHHPFYQITQITANQLNQIAISHANGISIYDEKDKKWTEIKNSLDADSESRLTKNAHQNSFYYIQNGGMSVVKNGKVTIHSPELGKLYNQGNVFMDFVDDSLYIFNLEPNRIFRYYQGKSVEYNHPKLKNLIAGKKINLVKRINDDLWICTYEGVIRFRPRTGEVQTYYSFLSFSDILLDQEGNFWFSTINAGIIRVPNLSSLVWNRDNDKIRNDRVVRVTHFNEMIYFATSDGVVYVLNKNTREIQSFKTQIQADIQSFDFEPSTGTLQFNIADQLFSIRNGKLTSEIPTIKASKTWKKWNDTWLVGSSQGFFIKTKTNNQKLDVNWVRQLKLDPKNKRVWSATNQGLILWENKNQNWEKKRTFLPDIQIRSIDFNPDSTCVYGITFNGILFEINEKLELKKWISILDKKQFHKIKFHQDHLYLATNEGLGIYSLKRKKLIWKTKNSDLTSNLIQDIAIVENQIWLATGKGLQCFPLHMPAKNFLADIDTRILVDNKPIALQKFVEIKEGQSIKILLNTLHYSSGGEFVYRYKTAKNVQKWSVLPGSTQAIPLLQLPEGTFEIEIVVVNLNGEKISGSFYLNGIVHPKFWKTKGFIALLLIVVILLATWIYKRKLAQSRKKAQLENELTASKLTAIQSQMNPHFLFNSLNSIQDLILKGDVENSYSYITTFSNLVRKTLNYSDKDFIEFSQEIALLELYLSLEKLRFKNQLEYTISIEKTDEFLLPPFLIQPFVENALLHGLLHKEGQRILEIQFQMISNNNLICIIRDNGLGREEAEKINSRKRKWHESFSNKAMLNRFELISKMTPGKYGYTYRDLTLNDRVIGTEVEICIPIKPNF